MGRMFTLVILAPCVATAWGCGGQASGNAPRDGGADAASTVGAPDSSDATTNEAGATGGQTGAGPVGLDLSSCTKASDCVSGEVCCGSVAISTTPTLRSVCQNAPCTPLMVVNVAIQFCSTASECPAGDTCAGPPAAQAAAFPAVAALMFCIPPLDAGAGGGGGGAGGTGDAGTGDAGLEDASSGD